MPHPHETNRVGAGECPLPRVGGCQAMMGKGPAAAGRVGIGSLKFKKFGPLVTVANRCSL